MKFFLLIAFVIAVGIIISRLLIEAASLTPIERRPEGLPDRAQPSQTNAVPSPAPVGTTLFIVTNAEIYIEADVERSYDLSEWALVGHLDILLPEEDEASGSASLRDGEVTIILSASVHSDPILATAPRLSLDQPRWHTPHPPPAAFYRLTNLRTWRNEYHIVTTSAGPAY